MINEDIELQLKDWFDENYEMLRFANGHALNPMVKKIAFQHVLQYWKKLSDLATKVDETELKLFLSGLETPKGNKFSILAYVDIARTQEEVFLYDIKTENVKFLEANRKRHEDQLNLYSKMYYDLYGDPMAKAAVIATGQTEELKKAWEEYANEGDNTALEQAIRSWNPYLEVKVNKETTTEVLNDFGNVVDKIESKEFVPPPSTELETKVLGKKNTNFAQHVCDNCDGRFSCTSFKAYIIEEEISRRGKKKSSIALLKQIEEMKRKEAN
ncbi:TPA: hypothetical protein ACGXMA_002396 [Bacillus cereus]|uniref:hypothetical protein n=1 Tax=Bacillus paramobilis TaxID=2817477 RepID=UPI00300B4599|nr:hypothetical protein [Bacillus cereus]HDR4610635.1 hypothetical protein [Bacillus cereus]HDR4628136.1 hypothetical protein [Bacillus cereus]HDR4662731.1 hypothetical protein [Bacillus cereus]HDR4929835.1 hypothetical protein [Bacillus cereus]